MKPQNLKDYLEYKKNKNSGSAAADVKSDFPELEDNSRCKTCIFSREYKPGNINQYSKKEKMLIQKGIKRFFFCPFPEGSCYKEWGE